MISHSVGEAPLAGRRERLAAVVELLLTAPTDRFGIQLLRYAVVGGGAYVVDFGLLVALTELASLHYLISAAIGFTAGLIVNYLVSTAWVFQRRRLADQRIEFALYAAIGLLGLVLTELLMWALTDGVGLHYALSKVGTALLVCLWNFVARRTVLFS